MSGLTGYLLADGTDLSYVFLPISTTVSGLSLTANNTFTGNNTFNGLTTMNGGIALPSNGTATSNAQLGYNYMLGCTVTTFASNTPYVVATLPANTLVPGTYIVNVVYPLVLQWSALGALSLFLLSLTTVSGQFNTTNTLTNTTVPGPFTTNNGTASGTSACNFTTIIIISNVSVVYYLNVKITYSGTATITSGSLYPGTLLFTRIA
jgi:hypothetical protein